VAGSLSAVPFDIHRLEPQGNPVALVEHVAIKGNSAAANFSLGKNGTLVYRTGDDATAQVRTLVWVDRQGHEESVGAPQRAYVYPRLSPDGTRIALDIRDQENDIWVWDIAHRNLKQLTFDPGFNRGGVWSPDGKRIAFSVESNGSENLYWQSADGTGKPERLTEGPTSQFPTSFNRDGTRLIFSEPSTRPSDIAVVNTTGDRRAELLLHGPQSENNGELSPDGRWLAYSSDESNRQDEVYVRPFPNVDGGLWKVSTNGGTRPAWSRDGRELFYYQLPGKIVAVPIHPGPTFAADTPHVVVNGRYEAPQDGRTYDVSSDGKRFLMIKNATTSLTSSGAAPPSQLVVVTNWFEELKARVPTK
jgi:serine/threonine-protein kinase